VTMRTYLNCPYAQRAAAKAAGARWDPERRQWYYDGAPLPPALARFVSAGAGSARTRARAPGLSTCRECGQTGRAPEYPFSVFADHLCDDCAPAHRGDGKCTFDMWGEARTQCTRPRHIVVRSGHTFLDFRCAGCLQSGRKSWD
jgi:hypothetical protein